MTCYFVCIFLYFLSSFPPLGSPKKAYYLHYYIARLYKSSWNPACKCSLNICQWNEQILSGTYKVTPKARDDIFASFCVPGMLSNQQLPGEGESRLSGNVPLGSAAGMGPHASATHPPPCCSSFGECNSGYTLNSTGVGWEGRSMAGICNF